MGAIIETCSKVKIRIGSVASVAAHVVLTASRNPNVSGTNSKSLAK
jgi:hypothetical protein